MILQFAPALLIIVVLLNLALGIGVLVRNPSEKSNIGFFFITLSISVWALGDALLYAVQATGASAYAIALIIYAGAGMIPLSFFYFTLMFDDRSEKASRWGLVLCGLGVLALAALLSVPHFVIESVNGIGSQQPVVFSSGYVFYAVFIVLFFLFGFYQLLQKTLRRTGLFRKQLLYVLVGSLVASLIGVVTNLILPWYGLFHIFWLGPVAAMLFTSAIFYAIVRYRLFNLKLIAVEAVIFILASLLIVNLILSQGVLGRLMAVGLLFLTFVLGYYLSHTIRKDVKQREHLRDLAKTISKTNEKLEVLDTQKTEFISLASHQLRTPLTAMTGYASMLIEGSFGALEGDVKTAVKEILEESQVLGRAVENLLVVSRIEQGRVQYNYGETGFRLLVRQIFESWFPLAQQQGVEMTFESQGASRYEVWGDEEKLKLTVTNIIENALQYTQDGYIRLTLSQKKGKLRLSISDTGRGMSPEELTRAFQNFKDNNTDRRELQTQRGFKADMGLYISKEFIKAHGGGIWCESPGRGKGSTFFIELPIYVKKDKKHSII